MSRAKIFKNLLRAAMNGDVLSWPTHSSDQEFKVVVPGGANCTQARRAKACKEVIRQAYW
jgi:hypothetical protein